MGREAGRTPERGKERAWGVRRARPLAWEKDEGCQAIALAAFLIPV